MRLPKISLALTLAVLATAALATATPSELTLQPGSRLWLKGSSTVHDYTGNASKLEVTVKTDPAHWPASETGAAALETLIRDAGVASVDVVVPVAGLQSGKDGLDKNMHKALKAATNPAIRFHMSDYQLGEVVEGAIRVEAKGVLAIAGVEREIPIVATLVRDGESVRLRGNVPLLMTQFGIKPPTMMMGAIRTSDQVVVSFDLLLDAAPVSSPMSSNQ